MFGKQRATFIALFEPSMLNLSKMCAVYWSKPEHLDKMLKTRFVSIPYCHLIYAVNKYGKQISSNINAYCIEHSYYNQDLSTRPYSISFSKKRQFLLSTVYINQNTGRPCISAVQPVIDNSQQFLGFIMADFDYQQLPLSLTPSNLQQTYQPSPCYGMSS